jgi:hypothetical protein
MARRRVAVGLLALVLPLVFVNGTASADPASDEVNFFSRLNAVRTSRGLRPLVLTGQLSGMARGWSGRMASRGGISHNPNLAAQGPPGWTRLGENVGMGPSVDEIHDALVASPSHYANIVSVHYDSVGVGVVQSGSTKFVTFNFMAGGASRSSPVPQSGRPSAGSRPAATAAARPAPTSAPAPSRQSAPVPASPTPAAAPVAPPEAGPAGAPSVDVDLVRSRLGAVRDVSAERQPSAPKHERAKFRYLLTAWSTAPSG